MKPPSPSTVLENAFIVVLLLSAHFGMVRAQSASTFEIERGRYMLKMIKADVQKHYYDGNFRGVDIEAVFSSADEMIKKADSNGQIFGIIARVMIEFNDSHLYFMPPSRNARIEYGWQMQMIGDNCHVVAVKPGSDAEAKGLKEGDRIYLINEMKPTREEFWKLEYLINVLRPTTKLRVIVERPGSQPRELDILAKVREGKLVTGYTYNEITRLEIEEERDARLRRHRYVEMQDDVFVWKMPQFDMPKEKVDDMVNKFRNHKAVIIDLRGNGGGFEETLLRLIGWFVETDVKVGDLKRRKDAKPLVAKSVGERAYKGKLVVLVDSKSGSSAELFARVMQLEKRGKVIGDRTAGAVMRSRYHPYSVGMETVAFFGASITDADLIMTDGKSLESVGVIPDEMILPEPADLAAKRDPVLARAFALLDLKTAPEQAGALFPVEWRK